jgi:hypothetical protein
VYTGGNVIFRSRDKGYTWEQISPDLTTNDKSKQKSSGGEIYQDNTAAEFHCTILSIAESPLQKDVIWAGTDDGNVQLTRDGGKTWTNLKANITGLPAFAWVSKIHASEHDAGTAFVTVDQHRMDDYKPYAFMTTDYGKTWTKISTGLPEDWCYVVRQDPHNANLLFAGMEHGIFASWDKGKTWLRLNNNMPPVSVRDLRIQKRDRDLVAATHGRGLWIMDDIQPLEDWGTTNGKSLVAFPVRTATLWNMYSLIEEQGDREYRAKNPTYGAYFNFYLQNDPKGAITIDITDANGNKVRSLKDTVSKAGINRAVWDLRYQEAIKINTPVASAWSSTLRPLVGPGTYMAKLTVDGESAEVKFTVRADPRIAATEADYRVKTETTLALRDQLNETHQLINRTDEAIKQLNELKQRIKSAGNEAGVDATTVSKIEDAVKRLKEYEDEILRRPPPNMGYRQRPRLKEEISDLMGAIDDAMARPTQPQLGRLTELKQEVVDAKNQLERIINEDVVKINEATKNLPAVVIKSAKSEM